MKRKNLRTMVSPLTFIIMATLVSFEKPGGAGGIGTLPLRMNGEVRDGGSDARIVERVSVSLRAVNVGGDRCGGIGEEGVGMQDLGLSGQVRIGNAAYDVSLVCGHETDNRVIMIANKRQNGGRVTISGKVTEGGDETSLMGRAMISRGGSVRNYSLIISGK